MPVCACVSVYVRADGRARARMCMCVFMCVYVRTHFILRVTSTSCPASTSGRALACMVLGVWMSIRRSASATSGPVNVSKSISVGGSAAGDVEKARQRGESALLLVPVAEERNGGARPVRCCSQLHPIPPALDPIGHTGEVLKVEPWRNAAEELKS